MEVVHFPEMPAKRDRESSLEDQWTLAKVVEHLICVLARDLVLELGAHRANRDTLDGQETALADRTHSHGSLFHRRQVTLSVVDPVGQFTPLVAGDQKLTFDLYTHRNLRSRAG